MSVFLPIARSTLVHIYSLFFLLCSLKKHLPKQVLFYALLLLAEGVEAREGEISKVELKTGGGNNVFVFEHYHGQGRHFKILFHYYFSFHYLIALIASLKS